MPALSPTMTQGNIARWKVKEGDEIRAGDSVAEIETDKATMEFESQEDGFLAKIVVGDGAQNVPVGAIVAVMVEDEEHVSAFAGYVPPAAAAAGSTAAPAPGKASSSSSPILIRRGRNRRANVAVGAKAPRGVRHRPEHDHAVRPAGYARQGGRPRGDGTVRGARPFPVRGGGGD